MRGLAPGFIDGARGRLFVLLREAPADHAGRCVLVVPPFAEEMNKSRRMISLLAAELARYGVSTLLVDLFGTGDSEGDFRDADWDLWKSDLDRAASWAEAQGRGVTDLLAIRLGCPLAAEAAREYSWNVQRSVFWQPVVDGSRMLDQFLRLRVAAAMMEHDRKETTAQLRQRLFAGDPVEVAGYALSGTLAAQLDKVRLQAHMGAHLGDVQWLEIVRSSQAPAAALKAFETARDAGVRVSMQTVSGEPFWSSVEIIVNQTLVEHCVAFLASRTVEAARTAAAARSEADHADRVVVKV